MPKQKVKNLAMLEAEVTRLRTKSRKLEAQLGKRFDHLKGNYKTMAMNTVVPGIANNGVMGFVGRVAKLAWESGKAKSVLSHALVTALEFLGVRLGIKLVDHYRNRRHRKKAAAKAAGSKEQRADQD